MRHQPAIAPRCALQRAGARCIEHRVVRDGRSRTPVVRRMRIAQQNLGTAFALGVARRPESKPGPKTTPRSFSKRRRLVATHGFSSTIWLMTATTGTGATSPNFSTGTRDLRGCLSEQDCATGAQPMPAGIGERSSEMAARGRRANPRSPGRPKWLGPNAGNRRTLQRPIVDARGRPGEICGLADRITPWTLCRTPARCPA